MSKKLIVNDGRRQRELLLVSKIVVGRDPTCDLSEADPLLSRRHAEFAVSGDDIVVRDLGSRNGIYVNGERVAEETLQSGDVVRIGHLQMRYVEDSSPLVAVPELIDDATGLVLSGPRTPKPPAPASASGAMPKPAAASGAMPKPAPASVPRPRPAPAPPADSDADVTSYASPSAIRRAPGSNTASESSAQLSQPKPASSSGVSSGAGSHPAPPPEDEAMQTRVVPAPGRTGLRPPMRPSPLDASAPRPGTSVQPPPSPQDDEMTSYVNPRRSPAGQPPEVAHTAVVQPPSSPAAMPTALQPTPSPPVMHTAMLPPPSPPTEDADEATSVVLAPRPRTRIEPPPVVPQADDPRQARAIAMAVEAIAAFLGSSSISRPAGDAVKTLERDLAGTHPPADLVTALKGLVARLSAAANELT